MAKHAKHTVRRHWDIDGDRYTVYNPDNDIAYQSKDKSKADAYAARHNKRK